MEKIKILIVDDEFILRRFAREILSRFGECDIAVSGQEALAAFEKAHENNNPYDLITMDIMMPDLTGIEVLKNIRNWEKKHNIPDKKQVRVIMITGSQDKIDFLHSFQQGCEAYVLKPYYPEHLLEAVKKLGLVKNNT
ncbi:Signal transduction response regulator, receiver domain-containing protein [Desulfonema limicola]|uniref:Signal transduction response regulator, receiver domain-containing protein n=1 Tax=Desulfonema limicola TaxID=45656 RepID=A0A975BEB1_9BACT|nr:response regulator [Desulfonema limicola]QTA83947.1 Signal transduction response regulator, receiver domain-containing protein [Desulfonema limicola]